MGALYLENNLTPRAFTSRRIAVLELLASQAAISLENARLYKSLELRAAEYTFGGSFCYCNDNLRGLDSKNWRGLHRANCPQ